jgi:hypothetical protein
MTLAKIEEERDVVYWPSVPRGCKWEDLFESSSVQFSSVQFSSVQFSCAETAFLNCVERFSLESVFFGKQ